jgi:hypothetical protein
MIISQATSKSRSSSQLLPGTHLRSTIYIQLKSGISNRAGEIYNYNSYNVIIKSCKIKLEARTFYRSSVSFSLFLIIRENTEKNIIFFSLC